MIHLLTDVPVLVIGGAPGAMYEVTLVSHVPAIMSSALCCGPGVMAFRHASIAAFSSGDISFLEGSCADATAAQTRSRATGIRALIFMPGFLLLSLTRHPATLSRGAGEGRGGGDCVEGIAFGFVR